MFKTDLPPDSSWKWKSKVKTYKEPLDTGRYILVDDHTNVVNVYREMISKLLLAMGNCEFHSFNDQIKALCKEAANLIKEG